MKVRMSNDELIAPKTIMKLRTNVRFQACGLSSCSGSTSSVAMVVAGKSVRKLISRI